MELDLHIHSRYSFDSNNDVREIIKRAKKLGLDGIAVVDHHNLGGGLEALGLSAEEREGIVVIAGMEVMTHFGDVMGLFLKEPLESVEPLEIIAEIKRQEGVAVLPHPYFSEFLQHRSLLEHFDAIEACNGRHQLDSGLDVDETQRRIEDIARQYGLAIVGGSDAHSYSEIGIATTIAPAETAEDVKTAILTRRTTVTHRGRSRFQKFFFGP